MPFMSPPFPWDPKRPYPSLKWDQERKWTIEHIEYAIVKGKGSSREWVYWVKWWNWPQEWNTIEPEAAFQGDMAVVLKKFWRHATPNKTKPNPNWKEGYYILASRRYLEKTTQRLIKLYNNEEFTDSDGLHEDTVDYDSDFVIDKENGYSEMDWYKQPYDAESADEGPPSSNSDSDSHRSSPEQYRPDPGSEPLLLSDTNPSGEATHSNSNSDIDYEADSDSTITKPVAPTRTLSQTVVSVGPHRNLPQRASKGQRTHRPLEYASESRSNGPRQATSASGLGASSTVRSLKDKDTAAFLWNTGSSKGHKRRRVIHMPSHTMLPEIRNGKLWKAPSHTRTQANKKVVRDSQAEAEDGDDGIVNFDEEQHRYDMFPR